MKKLMFAVAMAAAMTASADFVMQRNNGQNLIGVPLKVTSGSYMYAVYLGSNLNEAQAAAKAEQLWSDVTTQAGFNSYVKLSAAGGVDSLVTKVSDNSFKFDTLTGTIDGANEANAWFSVVLLDTTKGEAWVGNAFKYSATAEYLPGMGGYSPAPGQDDPFHTVSTTAVPEPTSALLMLLGMAGLALRRKQA